MRTIGLLFTAALAALVMLGCMTRSEGQLGHASFAWQECVGGCGVADNPMAAGGARAEMSVSLAAGYSFTQLKSTNPSVATFTLGGANGLDIVAVSGAPGQTQLQLLDAAGKLVDEVTVTATATAKLAVQQGWTTPAPLVLEGTTQTFHVTTVDANDHTLVGTGAVSFALAAPLSQADGIVFGDTIAFSGHAGDGAITARTSSVALTQPITIVPLSAVTRLPAQVQANTSDATGVYANVIVTPQTDAGGVYGATCSWTVADPSVVVQSQTTSSLESAPAASTKLLMQLPGTYGATCTVGAVATTVELHR